MHVSRLNIYPIQSMQGIEMGTVFFGAKGPDQDREWHLIDVATGQALSQSTKGCEKMAGFAVQLVNRSRDMIISAPDHGQIELTRIFARSDAGDDAANWFSSIMGRECRLVRRVKEVGHSLLGKTDKELHQIRSFPVHIISSVTLRALQAEGMRADESNFRASIEIDGDDLKPGEEDTVLTLAAGDALFQCMLPQGRCKITTLNQKTGEMDPESQPLRTLAKQRFGRGSGIQGSFFGQRAIVLFRGTVGVGDKVEIMERRPVHEAVANCALRYQP